MKFRKITKQSDFPLFFFYASVKHIVQRETPRTDHEKDEEHHHIYECKFSLRQNRVMHVEICNSHGDDHGNKDDPLKQSRYQEKRTAELAENRKHQCHVASQAKNAGVIERQLVEIHHLVHTVQKEKHSEEHSDSQNQKGNSLPSEILGK